MLRRKSPYSSGDRFIFLPDIQGHHILSTYEYCEFILRYLNGLIDQPNPDKSKVSRKSVSLKITYKLEKYTVAVISSRNFRIPNQNC